MAKAVLLCGFLILCSASAVRAQECKVLRIGGNNDWLPVAYIDQNTKKPKGIGYDFAKMIGKGLGIPVKLDATLPWKRLLHDVENGNLDMITAIFKTPEREKLYQYTDSYFVNESRAFVIKGNEFPLNKLEDLIGRIGGIPLGGSFGVKFDSFAKKHKLELEEVQSYTQMTQKVLAGRNDYFIQDYLDGLLSLKKNGLQDRIAPLPYPISTTDVYFAVSRKSPCVALVPQINTIIKKSKQEGTLQALVNVYIKKSISQLL